MNIENILVMICTVLFGVFGIVLLRYEWKKQMNLEESASEPLPTGLWVYGGVMLVMQIVLAYLLLTIYPENTACMVLKRLGLLTLIWQAAAIDWKYQKIPNDIILVGLAFRVIMLIPEYIFDREIFLSNLIEEGVALIIVVILVVICLLLMKNSIGMGDVKLLMLMALCQGISGIAASCFLSMVVSFFVAVALLISKKKSRKDTLSFAPCILVGTFLSVFLTGI